MAYLSWLIRKRTLVLCLRSFKWTASWQNQQNGLCIQRWLRSAWASVWSDQGLSCPHEETLSPPEATHWVCCEVSDQTEQMPSLGWAHRSFCWFVMRLLKCACAATLEGQRCCFLPESFSWPIHYVANSQLQTAKAVATLRRSCAGSTEPSLFTYLISDKYLFYMSWFVFFLCNSTWEELHLFWCKTQEIQAPCRRRDWSFCSAKKGGSENQDDENRWRGCRDKNRLKKAKIPVRLVLSRVPFKSGVWN